MTWVEVERLRDRTFHRLRTRRVRGVKSALAFINAVGFCTAFTRHEHLPCLWVAVCGQRRPRMSVHSHSDYALGLTWGLKDRLPDERRVFYAKLFCGKPSLISLDLLPHFYRVFGPEGRGSESGAPGLTEQAILDWLATHPPQPTWQLRLHGDFRGRLSKARFEKAMARLQERFYVIKTQTVYEPKFTYFWGLFERVYPQAASRARGISYKDALRTILRKYFDVAVCARRRDLLSIFRGVDITALDATLEDLLCQKVLLSNVEIPGAQGAWHFLNRDKMILS